MTRSAVWSEGVRLEDGMTSPAHVKKVRKVEANSWLEITIREGRKHQVKRMLEAVGHPVFKLTADPDGTARRSAIWSRGNFGF